MFEIVISIMLAMTIGFFAPRGICLWLAGLGLVAGIIVPLLVWGYAEIFVQGDPSAYGMLGTICFLLFAPSGFILGVLGLLKSK